MQKIYLATTLLSTLALCDTTDKEIENRVPSFYNNQSVVHLVSEIGYTNYGIDITSTEFNRAIDYQLVELTVGAEYHYNRWGYGAFYKFSADEIGTNSIVDDTGGEDKAHVDRDEFVLSLSYLWKDFEFDYKGELFSNLSYYSSSLKSDDSFEVFNTYTSSYRYDTQGVSLSLSSVQKPWGDAHALTLTGGFLYTVADIGIYATKNAEDRAVYVKDSGVGAYGVKFGIGYAYEVNPNFGLKISTDWYYLDFEDINIYSHEKVGLLEKGTLNESTYSLRVGGAYRF